MKEWKIEQQDNMMIEVKKKVENKKIVLTTTAYKQVKTLLNEYKTLEWMAGLITEEKSNEIIVKSLVLYDQEVTSSTVELTDIGNIEISKNNEIKGWIHSHNEMEVFFSNTDIGTAKWNQLSLVVNNKLEFVGKMNKIMKIQIDNEEIEANAFIDCDIYVPYSEYDKKYAETAKKMIKEKVYKQTFNETCQQEVLPYQIKSKGKHVKVVLEKEFANFINIMHDIPVVLSNPNITFVDNKEIWEYEYNSKKQAKENKKEIEIEIEGYYDTYTIKEEKVLNHLEYEDNSWRSIHNEF